MIVHAMFKLVATTKHPIQKCQQPNNQLIEAMCYILRTRSKCIRFWKDYKGKKLALLKMHFPMVFKLYKKTIKCASNWGPYKPIIFCLFPKFFIFQRLKVFYEGHFKGKFTLVENLPYQELLTFRTFCTIGRKCFFA